VNGMDIDVEPEDLTTNAESLTVSWVVHLV
jgi:hypothetical protein